MFNSYKHFLDGMPFYLARHYWWAYLWWAGVRFFDHQPIINAILFGQYRKLMETTLSRLDEESTGKILQMTCVYGSLTSNLTKRPNLHPLHIMDVAPIQLKLALRKCGPKGGLIPARMNAECMGYRSNTFDTVVLFFLLHEMPYEARQRAMSEAIRIINPGGRLIITEYAPISGSHVLHRFPPFRWMLTKLEPFLDDFWREDLTGYLNKAAAGHGKRVLENWYRGIFGDFYRVVEYRVIENGDV